MPYVTPDFGKGALLTIDVQRDFLEGGASPIEGTTAVVPKMAELARAFRQAGRPVIHMVRIYYADGSNADAPRREALERGARIVLPGSAGMQLAGGLTEEADARLEAGLLLTGAPQRIGGMEYVLYKPRWGAFFRTGLERLLGELCINTLIICGCNFPNCPRTSIYEASERDFRLALASDAISGLYERGSEEMRGIGVALMTTEEICHRVRSA